MPTIRDGRGKLTVQHNDPPPAVPPGPVERRQVSAARMADFAAERAAGADAVAPTTWRSRGGGRPRTTPEQRQARIDRFLQAVRSSGSHAEAAEKLHVSAARVAQFIGELRRSDKLPVDVDNQLRARANQRPVPTNGVEAPAPVEQPAVTVPERPRGLPCPGCIHAAVCSLRLPLEKAYVAALTPQSPDPAIEFLIASVDVACRHYLKAGAA